VDGEEPSRTALATAHARAYHQIADQPRILTDPFVARLLGVTADELARLDRPDRPRRLFFAARARFAEDCVAVAVASGASRVVILGAGLDAFAYRNPYPDLRVFEVDHPATQVWKRERLAAAGIDRPEALTFVPVDFETSTLAPGLETAGFSRTDPAVFVWLGVVFYLTPDAAHATLEYIAGQASPVEVIFDYLQPADTDEDRADLRGRADRLAAAGDPGSAISHPRTSLDSCALSASPTSKITPPRASSWATLMNPQHSSTIRHRRCERAAYCERAAEDSARLRCSGRGRSRSRRPMHRGPGRSSGSHRPFSSPLPRVPH